MLPTEVLLHIWVHLETPRSLASTSKRFHSLSQDTLWRAKWLIKRYDLYEVMYEALARPHLFTVELFHKLLWLKVPLTPNVVQLLSMLHNPTAAYELRQEECVLWGRLVRFSAYSAVMSWAVRLVSIKVASKAASRIAD